MARSRDMKKSPMLESLHRMFQDIELGRDMVVDRLEMDAFHFAKLRKSCGDVFDVAANDAAVSKGIAGWLWAADVYVGSSFGKPQAFGRDELPPEGAEGTLWIRRGWETPE